MKKIFSVFDKKDFLYSTLAIAVIAIGSVFDVLSPFFYSRVMNELNPSHLIWKWDFTLYFTLMIIFPFITIVCSMMGVLFATKASVSVTTKLRSTLYKKSLYLSASDLDRISGASIVTRTTGDIVQILTFLIMFFSTFIKAISLIIGGFTLSIIQLATFGDGWIWYLAFAYLLFPLMLLVLMGIMKKGLPLFKKTRVAIDENNVIMQENILGNRLVRAFNLQSQQSERYEIGNNNLRVRSIKSDKLLVLIFPIITLVMNLSSVMIFMFSGIYVIENPSPIVPPDQQPKSMEIVGVAQAFINYFLQMLVGLSLVGMVSFNFTRARSCTARVFEVIDIENPIKDGNFNKNIENGDIVFKNVSFKYNDTESNNVISNINLEIKSGQTIGILGQTGSGKTTLVNLLTRLYDVSDGEILIDDVNVKDYKLDNLRESITMAMQDRVLIRGTIKSNILIGNRNATDEEILRASKDAQAYEFISKMPNKFDSIVEQKGKNFSGGQQQRISIARALVKKAKILIFDDSTSALDNITETKLLENLKTNYSHMTKILISQKIRTVQDADYIIVLKNGKIAEKGKHRELLKLKGLYKSIYDSQESSTEK